jgi:L-ascorbate metabolism protein UlaG (beta-lactamase superfamily)
MKITFYGHSSFGIETNGKNLVFDPFISPNDLAIKINIEGIPADYILVSHGHQDHVVDVETIAKRTGALVISNFEIVSWYGEKGVQGHPMNHGGKWKFDGINVRYVNAVHSSVLPDGTYGGNPGGFVVWNEEGCFYYAGDTALTMDMKLIPMICPKLDFAILPIGDNFTMSYEDAIIACDFIECDKVIGCHYDTFGYIEIDHQAAKKAFEDKGKELILLPIGESLDI